MLGFSSAARKLAPRDHFIGWTRSLREKNLPLVVDNPRFLILPWITIPNLGSHILSLVRRQLPVNWTERYRTTPVLIETFVETPRFTGVLYKASGWAHVGTTQGRGRYDRHTRRDQPKKDIWLRLLRKRWRRTLNRCHHPPPPPRDRKNIWGNGVPLVLPSVLQGTGSTNILVKNIQLFNKLYDRIIRRRIESYISPTFVARASRCRGDEAHGPKERMRAAEGVADTSACALSKRLEGIRLVTASRLASGAECW